MNCKRFVIQLTFFSTPPASVNYLMMVINLLIFRANMAFHYEFGIRRKFVFYNLDFKLLFEIQVTCTG